MTVFEYYALCRFTLSVDCAIACPINHELNSVDAIKIVTDGTVPYFGCGRYA